MSDRVAVVTGANAGLGFQLTRKLVMSGTRVIMACRNSHKAERALAELRAEYPKAMVTALPLDVSDLESVRAFEQEFARQVGHLDLLVNNAAVLGIPLTRNRAGHELQLATNYLGPFALTGAMLPYFRVGRPGRIVNVGSLSHRFGRIHVENLNWMKSKYRSWLAYANSKAALLSFTIELSRRLEASASQVVAVGAHPGFAATNIYAGMSLFNPRNRLAKWLVAQIEQRIPSAARASEFILHAANAQLEGGGQYWGPSGFLEMFGPVGIARVNPAARDAQLARALWSWTEEMIGRRFLSEHAAPRSQAGPSAPAF